MEILLAAVVAIVLALIFRSFFPVGTQSGGDRSFPAQANGPGPNPRKTMDDVREGGVSGMRQEAAFSPTGEFVSGLSPGRGVYPEKAMDGEFVSGSPDEELSERHDISDPTVEEKPDKSKSPGNAATLENYGFERLRESVLSIIIKDIPRTIVAETNFAKKRAMLAERIRTITFHESTRRKVAITPREVDSICLALLDDMIGFGPIQKLLDDDAVSEIMVNGPYQIYFEKQGKMILSEAKFKDNEHVMQIIERIVVPIGRRVDESHPYIEARLPDGSFVNAVIPPLALNGPTITIRKLKKEVLGIADLVRLGTLTEEAAKFIEACVKVRLNIAVSGGMGSGRTTTLNVLCSLIPEGERIIVCEDIAELQLPQRHVIRLKTRPPNVEGKGAIRLGKLIRNALKMRPERVIVGECGGREILDLLQLMDGGPDGSLVTCRGGTPRNMLYRLERMVLITGRNLPVRAVRKKISSAVHLIVQQSCLKDGTRKITNIAEVRGMNGNKIVIHDIFTFQETGVGADGKILGDLKATGIRPNFAARFEK